MRILAVIHEQRAEDSRNDTRRPVDINASLRMAGARGIGCVLSNISLAGFMARSYARVEPGRPIWLRVPGFPALAARVIWSDDQRLGCQFETPLSPEMLVRIVAEAPNLH
ncbi:MULTISPECIES: PilZ domain-containing protein [Sphingomonadales]|uniref:Uncharacterized protein n=1 Tax=Edaphosphingomonas haloaromaticamans TaxID=653954 RepID=A0A1S1HC27_9SPHN|nr:MULTISPECIES: PilZ domain-containing protein [Sphingomonas]AGH49732.1 hypothetical protein G432_10035 [Sphingomonas sp. MM-1]MDX3886254.1 PilZ domain-containing protein [Sphingomonas sp.]OHT18050.1 hypothetical protein BHE75_00018 [Sphingomonas haloaromaticamans]